MVDHHQTTITYSKTRSAYNQFYRNLHIFHDNIVQKGSLADVWIFLQIHKEVLFLLHGYLCYFLNKQKISYLFGLGLQRLVNNLSTAQPTVIDFLVIKSDDIFSIYTDRTYSTHDVFKNESVIIKKHYFIWQNLCSWFSFLDLLFLAHVCLKGNGGTLSLTNCDAVWGLCFFIMSHARLEEICTLKFSECERTCQKQVRCF